VYGDNGGRFPALGKGVGKPGPVEDKMLMGLKEGDVLEEDKL